jgi:hypothetical protein
MGHSPNMPNVKLLLTKDSATRLLDTLVLAHTALTGISDPPSKAHRDFLSMTIDSLRSAMRLAGHSV